GSVPRLRKSSRCAVPKNLVPTLRDYLVPLRVYRCRQPWKAATGRDTMKSIQTRLHEGAALLQRLELRRQETRSPRLGEDTEWQVIARELQDLEADILRDPGALESQLVRVKRPRVAR